MSTVKSTLLLSFTTTTTSRLRGEEKFEEDLILADVEEVDAVDDVRVNAPAEYKTNCIHFLLSRLSRHQGKHEKKRVEKQKGKAKKVGDKAVQKAKDRHIIREVQEDDWIHFGY